jgi:hypothetical protein
MRCRAAAGGSNQAFIGEKKSADRDVVKRANVQDLFSPGFTTSLPVPGLETVRGRKIA